MYLEISHLCPTILLFAIISLANSMLPGNSFLKLLKKASESILVSLIGYLVRNFKELGSYSEEPVPRSVGNSPALRETALIEAFNLKAAIEFITKNAEAAKESLHDMPPRNDDEQDPVTLHNKVNSSVWSVLRTT